MISQRHIDCKYFQILSKISFVLLFVVSLISSCVSDSSTNNYKQIDVIGTDTFYHLEGVIHKHAVGYRGVFCQGGMIMVKNQNYIENSLADTLYVLTNNESGIEISCPKDISIRIRRVKDKDLNDCSYSSHNFIQGSKDYFVIDSL